MWFDYVLIDDIDDELDRANLELDRMREESECTTFKRNGTYVTICNCKYGVNSHRGNK